MTPQRSIALVFAVHGAVAGTFATRIPWLQDRLGLSPSALGLVLLCSSIGAFITMPMASRVAHHVGGRTATRFLLMAWSTALALPAFAPGPVWLFATMLLFGATAGMCDVVMNAHAVTLERHLGRPIMSGLHGMWSIGSLAAGGAGVLAAQQRLDARVHFGLAAALLLGLALLAGRGLVADLAEPGAPAPRRFSRPSRAVLIIGLVGFCATFAEGASSNWAAVYMTRVAHSGPGVAAACYTLFMMSMAMTRLLGDRIVRWLGPVPVVRYGGALAVVGAVIVVAARTASVGILGFALVGVGVATVLPLVIAAAGNAGTTPGEGVAGVSTITYLSGLTAPAVTGWVAGGLSYPAAFVMVTGVVVVMTLSAGALNPGTSRARPRVRKAKPPQPVRIPTLPRPWS